MIEVVAIMVEIDSGGFSTGILKRGYYTYDQVKNNKYLELVKNIDLINGCMWEYRFNKIKNG